MPSTEIFFEHDRWGRNLSWSAGLHILVAVSIGVYALVAHESSGGNWGGGGGGEAMGVMLVSSVPLPATPTEKQNILANDSKGLTQSQPKAKENAPAAIASPAKMSKKKKNKPDTSSKQQKEQPQEEANNVAQYGEGGPVSGPYGTFSAAGAKGGFGFTGGGGECGNRYAWYVRVVAHK